jgi:hypothetical protein
MFPKEKLYSIKMQVDAKLEYVPKSKVELIEHECDEFVTRLEALGVDVKYIVSKGRS